MTAHEARRILETWQFVDDTQAGVIIRIPVLPREYDEFREIIRNSLLLSGDMGGHDDADRLSEDLRAAIEQLRGNCEYCKHFNSGLFFGCMACELTADHDGWEWDREKRTPKPLLKGPSSMLYSNPNKEVSPHTIEMFENSFMGSFRSWCRIKNKPETPMNMFLFLAKLGLIDVEGLTEKGGEKC